MEAKPNTSLNKENWDALGGNLIFIIAPERSGSTMLEYMIESHSKVHGFPEPHILVPMKFWGYYGHAEKAAYEPVNTSLSIKEFVDNLPNKEEDYLDACRAFAGTLYSRELQAHPGCRYFLDKTPFNALVWDFIVRVYPKAKYIVLTRHPLAIVESFAKTFFVGDYHQMRKSNTRIPDHIHAIAMFIRTASVNKHVIKYETLLEDAESETRKILDFLDLPFEQSVIEYGKQKHAQSAKGDPMTARNEARPQASYAWKWVKALSGNNEKIRTATEILSPLNDEDYDNYGYPRKGLLDPLEKAGADHGPKKKAALSHYQFQRHVYFLLRDLAKIGWIRKAVEKIKYFCEIILRD